LNLNVPILGICYGLQLLSHHFKGKVSGGKTSREYGKTKIKITAKSELFKGIHNDFTAWMSHGDHIEKLTREFKVTSRSGNGLISSFESVSTTPSPSGRAGLPAEASAQAGVRLYLIRTIFMVFVNFCPSAELAVNL